MFIYTTLHTLSMIEVLLYGDLKKKVEENIPDASSIMVCDYVEGEHLEELLSRLGLNLEHVGKCYINTKSANPDSILHDHDTIELNHKIAY